MCKTKKRLKKSIAIFMTLLFVLLLLPPVTARADTTYFEGSGTADDPYLIQSAADLAQLSILVNGSTAPYADTGVVYKLMNNIDLSAYASGQGWAPISIFNGTFDGNGKTISGLKINRPSVERQGLFGLIYLGTVKNLGVVNCDIIGKNDVGGLAGWNDGTVQNCYTTGIVSGATTIGGLVGYNTGTIQYCYSISTVSGNNLVGGIAGGNISSDGFLRNCYHMGAVRATSGYGGGVIGSDGVNLTACVTKDCVALEFAVDNGGAVVGFGDMSEFGNCSWEGIKGLRLRTPDLTGTVLKTADECVSAVQNIGFSSFTLNDLPQYMKGEYFPGAGTEEDPYQISTLDDLANLSLYINYGGMDYSGTCFKLMNDIDMNDYPYTNNAWAPIGTTTQFKGIFDGNGKVVKNLNINCLSCDYQGLFGQIGSGGIVKNLGVVDASVTGQNYVGGLAAVNEGTVQTCYVTGTVKGHTYTGGIAGDNPGNIQGCYSEGKVLSYEILSHVNRDEYTGGIAGRNNAGTIADCHSAAEVSGGYASMYIGGVAGGVFYSGQVENCYSTGPVNGEYNIGGIVGYLNEGSVTDCHSTGSVSGYSQSTGIGGVVGSIDLGQVEKCYSAGPVSGDRQCIGGVAGIIEQGTLKSCYSTSTVSSKDATKGKNIGGIVGEAYDCAIVENNIALGENVAGVAPVGRIFGFLVSTGGGSSLSGNYAWNGMKVNGSAVTGTPTDLNGGTLDGWTAVRAALDAIGFTGAVIPSYIMSNDATLTSVLGQSLSSATGGAGTSSSPYTYTVSVPHTVTTVSAADIVLHDAGAAVSFFGTDSGFATPASGGVNLTASAGTDIYVAVTAPDNSVVYYKITVSVRADTTYFAGSGTADDPYLIQSAADLKQLSILVNGSTAPYADTGVVYKLMNNIDLSAYASGQGWVPIDIFYGTFDGNGKTISGLKINRLGADNQGLFGIIDSSGTVKNLGVAHCDIIGLNCVGGLAGLNEGTLQNCYTTGIVSGVGEHPYYTGGVVGTNQLTGKIQYCYSISTVNGHSYVGGIAGLNDPNNGYIRNCYHIGAVRATSGYGGGVIGSDGVNLTACVTKDCVALEFAVDNGGAVVGFGDMSEFGNCSWEGIKGLRLRTPDLTGTVLKTADECVSAVQNIGFSSFTLNDLPQYMKGEYFPGAGTEEDPYQISTLDDLANLSLYINYGGMDYSGTCFKLMNDIDMNDYPYTNNAWAPIGTTTQFKGIFDGNGKVVKNLNINCLSCDYQGLFGQIGSGGIVKNLGVVDASVTGQNYVGGLAAVNEGTVQTCYVTGAVKGHKYTGGIAGDNPGNIQDCYSEGTVLSHEILSDGLEADTYTGGIAGRSDAGTIAGCHSAAEVSGGYMSLYTGGVAGGVLNSGQVESCYFTGSVSGRSGVGGIVGYLNEMTSQGSITDSHSSGSVSGNSDSGGVGGVVGLVLSGTVERCYSTGPVSGDRQCIGGIAGDLKLGTLKACYSTSTVSSRDSERGGIVGDIAGAVSKSIVENNVALGENIAGKVPVGRITGRITSGGTFSGNYAWRGMQVNGSTVAVGAPVDLNGEDLADWTAVRAALDAIGFTGAVIPSYIMSDDATLTSVLGQSLRSATGGAGASSSPYTYAVSVPHTVTTVSAGDIVLHDAGAVVSFFGTDSGFATPASGGVNLTASAGTDIYVAVTAPDNSVVYYKITVSVSAPPVSDKVLQSITAPTAVTGVANGSAKTAAALGLPTAVTMVTDGGSVQASVTWDVAGSSYDVGSTSAQTFTVSGTAALPAGVVNTESVSLTTSISVTVDAAPVTDKVLQSITAPTAVTGVANGAAKTAAALGLPTAVIMVTDGGSTQASVTWDVAGSSYDAASTSAQTFTVSGMAELPAGVVNTDSVSLITSISVTVDAAPVTDKVLQSITAPTAVTGVANGAAKTAAALGLPTAVTMVTDGGSVQASVTWDVAGSSYDAASTSAQTFTVSGTAALPAGVVNTDSVSLITSISVTVDAAPVTDKVLQSITAPTAVTGVANGAAKTAAALGLPTAVTMVTDGGSVQASVTWDVAGSSYDAASTSAQTFTVSGTAALPAGVVNTDSVSLITSISVTVDAAPVTDKVLQSITAPTAVTGVANGSAKTAAALGLPTAVTMVTDGGSVQASVTWDVAGSSYDVGSTSAQTFTVSGTAALPAGVVNTESVSLTTSISVTVDAAPVTDKVLQSITAPTAVTGVANGATKTAAALGLPTAVTMVTDGGSVQASVTWDVAGSSYDAASTSAQTFTVSGTAELPAGVVNTDSVSLITSISVTVDAAPVTDKVLQSITAPTAITGVVNGAAKTAAALGLPTAVTMVTDGGSVQASVTWDVAGSSYDAASTSAQTFTVSGTAELPAGVVNTDSVSLIAGIIVTVDAAPVTPPTPHTPSSSTDTPKVTTPTTNGGTNTVTTVVMGTTSGDTTTVSVSGDTMNRLITAAAGTNGSPVINITVPAVPNASGATVTIPGSSFHSMAVETSAMLEIKTGLGTVTFNSSAVENISGAASGDVNIGMSVVDRSTLSEATQQIVGDNPVYNFSITSNGQSISSFAGSQASAGETTVRVPYTPSAEQSDSAAIVVYYIDASDNLQSVNGHYEASTGTVVFTTNHFSLYMIGYNKVSFNDVRNGDWYYNAITFLSARGITTGTGNGNFSPDIKLTRGQFLVMTMRAFDLAPASNVGNNFADAGDNYYTGYLAAAKQLGITTGIGNNMFAPKREITRQEMFTLLYNTLKAIDQLPTPADSAKNLADFTDAEQIAAWAKDAGLYLVNAGTVGGSGGKLNPTATTTRAEMAQVLYNLLSN